MYEYIRKPILRKGANENAEAFGRRIMADYASRPKYYYNRHLSYRNSIELKLFEEDLILLGNDIIDKCQYGKFYRNVDACWNYNSPCPYSNICFAEKPDPLTLQLYYERKEIK
jgi:hypothetical protein